MSYKDGGLRRKYTLFKTCKHCDGDGYEPCHCGARGLADCNCLPTTCEECGGRQIVPCDADAVYFVLRLDSDPHALEAAMAYADSVASENWELACDIRRMVSECSTGDTQ